MHKKSKATLFAEVINLTNHHNRDFDSPGPYDSATGRTYPELLQHVPDSAVGRDGVRVLRDVRRQNDKRLRRAQSPRLRQNRKSQPMDEGEIKRIIRAVRVGRRRNARMHNFKRSIADEQAGSSCCAELGGSGASYDHP